MHAGRPGIPAYGAIEYSRERHDDGELQSIELAEDDMAELDTLSERLAGETEHEGEGCSESIPRFPERDEE
ncbi:MAG: hypothetical protein ABEH64_03160 [Salinirussus sp.]